MNTKMLFLLIVSLFIASNQFSIATTSTKHTTTETSTHNSGHSNTPDNEVPPMDLGITQPFQKTLTPNSDDDGKHHHFHFDRITCVGNRRLILLVLAKFLLVICHTCCFLYCVTHSFH